jgi:hypothetical protein
MSRIGLAEPRRHAAGKLCQLAEQFCQTAELFSQTVELLSQTVELLSQTVEMLSQLAESFCQAAELPGYAGKPLKSAKNGQKQLPKPMGV